jgi:hypothetical protein
LYVFGRFFAQPTTPCSSSSYIVETRDGRGLIQLAPESIPADLAARAARLYEPYLSGTVAIPGRVAARVIRPADVEVDDKGRFDWESPYGRALVDALMADGGLATFVWGELAQQVNAGGTTADWPDPVRVSLSGDFVVGLGCRLSIGTDLGLVRLAPESVPATIVTDSSQYVPPVFYGTVEVSGRIVAQVTSAPGDGHEADEVWATSAYGLRLLAAVVADGSPVTFIRGGITTPVIGTDPPGTNPDPPVLGQFWSQFLTWLQTIIQRLVALISNLFH